MSVVICGGCGSSVEFDASSKSPPITGATGCLTRVSMIGAPCCFSMCTSSFFSGAGAGGCGCGVGWVCGCGLGLTVGRGTGRGVLDGVGEVAADGCIHACFCQS